ncbi:MAG: arylsulfatase, partial [Gemmataceae bacterium]
HKIDGLDICPLMLGKEGAKSPHESYFFYWGRHLQAVRSGKWKLHFPHPYRTLAGRPGGKDGKPARYRQARTKLALFDLENDIGEKKNVAAEHPDVVARLKKRADAMRADLGDSATKQKGNGFRPAGQLDELLVRN